MADHSLQNLTDPEKVNLSVKFPVRLGQFQLNCIDLCKSYECAFLFYLDLRQCHHTVNEYEKYIWRRIWISQG